MPSILPNYEYDIFISYRQKDNRSDQWVTQFVQALKEELDATFKEDISVYFDENPHDGLHDTHDVDDSLKEKVKCLIFIPIVSRTYCDPKSFAWQKEFLPFLDFAKNDQFGLKVKLPNGNVTSRVLPIRIHDLDTEDVKLFEKETGSVIRSIDFVYQEAGVNRALQMEDKREMNLNKADYRNQINKVANALREIVIAIKSPPPVNKEYPPEKEEAKINDDKKDNRKRIRGWSYIIVVLIMIIGGLYLIFPRTEHVIENEVDLSEKTVAVLPFEDLSPLGDQEWFSAGLHAEIIQSLINKNTFKVIDKLTTRAFKNHALSARVIADSLHADFLIFGSTVRIKDELKVEVSFIDIKENKNSWSESFINVWDSLFDLQMEISTLITKKVLVNQYQNSQIDYISERPANSEAYQYFLLGNQATWYRYKFSWTMADWETAVGYYKKSLEYDSGFGRSYAALADLYANLRQYNKFDSLLNIAYRLNPRDPFILLNKATSFLYPLNNNSWGSFNSNITYNLDSAYFYFNLAYKLSLNDPLVAGWIGFYYQGLGLYKISTEFYNQVNMLDPLNIRMLAENARIQLLLNNSNQAKKLINKADQFSDGDSYNIVSIAKFEEALLYEKDTLKAKRIISMIDSTNYLSYDTRIKYYSFLGMEKKAINLLSAWTIKSPANSQKADVYLLLKNKHKAEQFIRRSTREYKYLNLKNHPIFEIIRGTSTYDSLLKGAEIIYKERLEKYGKMK